MNSDRLSELPYFMERFQEIVREVPHLPFFADAQHPEGVSRAETDERSARVYAWLKQRGVGREDMVMICLPRGVEIPIAIVGVWKAGAACTVAEDDLPAERIAFIRADCGCKLVIDADHWPEIMKTPPLSGFARADDHDVAFALYTSGSTGTPKGVLQEYGCIRMYRINGEPPTEDPEKAYNDTQIPPFHSVVGFNNVFKDTQSYECRHILPYEIAKDPEQLNRYFAEHNISHTFMPTSALRIIGRDLSPSLRFVAIGGEGANGLYLDGVTLENGYSMSELCYPLCRFVIDRPYPLCPVGKPASDVLKVCLLDAEGREVPDGEEGEICFENPFFRGYINRPEETREALRGGLFHSGDLGKWDENGNLLVTGRAGDMLKIGGNRVEPAEIEAAFMKVTGQSWCAVKGFTAGTRTQLCLYYRGESKLDVRSVREQLRAYLPDYMIPAVFRRVETVPMLPNGKTDKAALPAPDFNENRPAYAPPVTPEETALCRAFEAAFALEPIGLDDDFFDLGGDSLTAMAVIAETELTGLAVSDIFEDRTPRHIAAALSQRFGGEETDLAAAEARERGKVHPLSLHQIGILTLADAYNHPGLWSFDPSVDAQRLCDAVNRAFANRSALSMVVEEDAELGPVLRYDPSKTPRLEVQRLTEKEFLSQKETMVKPFVIHGVPLVHGGIYETERRVYLFLDVFHMIMDGSAMQLLYDDILRAYRGEALEQDTFCIHLSRTERERATERYQKALEDSRKILEDEAWRNEFAPDRYDEAEGMVFTPCRRMITPAEAAALSTRLKTSINFLGIALMLLAGTKLDGEGRMLCNWVFHNRTDKVRRSAFGLVFEMATIAVDVRYDSSVADFFTRLKACWADCAANISAVGDSVGTSPRGAGTMSVVYQAGGIAGEGGLAALGAKQEEIGWAVGNGDVCTTLFLNETPEVIAPMLMISSRRYSPKRQEEIIDTLGEVIDRLVALTDPEETTVGELLG